MSYDHNHKLWVTAKKDIDRLIQRQNILKRLEPVSEPEFSYKIFSELYILYAELANKLADVYAKTFQAQKRQVIRVLVEAANRRLLELKNELKNLELSEYIYTDKALIARKLTPYDLEIWRSPAFRRPPEIQNIIYKNELFGTEDDKEKELLKKQSTLKNAIVLIQSHERARRARVYRAAINYDIKYLKVPETSKVVYKFRHGPDQPMSIPVKRTIFNPNYIRDTESCCKLSVAEDLVRGSSEDHLLEERDKAARIIQNAWRRYKSRKILRYKYAFKETLYSVVKKRRPVRENDFKDAVLAAYRDEILKAKLDEEFAQFVLDERNRFLVQRGPWIMEDISDHIRGWFRDFYDGFGQFHPFPDPVKQNGTVLVLIDESYSRDEYQDKLNEMSLSKEEKKKLAEKRKALKKKQRDKIKKEKMKEAKRRKKMKDAGIIDFKYELDTNKNIQAIENTIKDYSIDWKLVDEYLLRNKIVESWVAETELAKIHKELRALVDEYMRVEYELLQQALCLDLKKKYKKPKVKKPKKPKRKKGKKVFDPTADRSVEELYKELEDAGIIEKISHHGFDKFIGEFNFVADDTRDEYNLTTLDPTKGDIRMVIQECMLGMGEFDVDKPKALCLVGPNHSGKNLICKIIASELDAVFMNLSPEKTSQYADDIDYLLSAVLKVAKAFQPTIMFIRDIHRVFWKKIPKDVPEDLNPRLLEKDLAKKLMKPIKKQEKIMLLGTSDQPWTAKPKMKKNFQKVLLIPPSDYGSSFLIWMEYLTQLAGDYKLEECDISALAKVFQKYHSGDITENVETVLNVVRRMKLGAAPLDPQEFVNHFMDRAEPIFQADEKLMAKFQKWFSSANKMSKLKKAFLKKKQEKQKKK